MSLSKFTAYNNHLIEPKRFAELDNHMRILHKQPYVYKHPLIDALPKEVPGIYTLGGGRQIGKTTLLKQWINALLQAKIDPSSIIFLTRELIDDFHILSNLLQTFILEHPQCPYLYIIIDEITYVKHWERAIKFIADAGYFENAIVILMGSDLTLMQSAHMTFPGRRGKSDKVDYHIYPLSFKQTVILKNNITNLEDYCKDKLPTSDVMQQLFFEFDSYLQHGGYLTAINDVARDGKIAASTLQIYSDWIRGDMLKRGKQELYLKEILFAILKRYNKQVSWHSIADALSIDSHKTVSDYCELLACMDALFIQQALLLDKLVAAPKKAKKLIFTDPFIYHAIHYWLNSSDQDASTDIKNSLKDPVICGDLAEMVVTNHYRRHYPTYYIKAEGEIDIAYIDQDNFWPIEVKWRNPLRPEDLKQVKKYKNSRVLSKVHQYRTLDNISIEPLPLALIRNR